MVFVKFYKGLETFDGARVEKWLKLGERAAAIWLVSFGSLLKHKPHPSRCRYFKSFQMLTAPLLLTVLPIRFNILYHKKNPELLNCSSWIVCFFFCISHKGVCPRISIKSPVVFMFTTINQFLQELFSDQFIQFLFVMIRLGFAIFPYWIENWRFHVASFAFYVLFSSYHRFTFWFLPFIIA